MSADLAASHDSSFLSLRAGSERINPFRDPEIAVGFPRSDVSLSVFRASTSSAVRRRRRERAATPRPACWLRAHRHFEPWKRRGNHQVDLAASIDADRQVRILLKMCCPVLFYMRELLLQRLSSKPIIRRVLSDSSDEMCVERH